MELTVPNMLPQAFQRYFRLKQATVNKLINFLQPSPRLQRRQNIRTIPVWKKVYMTLAYLGTQASTHKYVPIKVIITARKLSLGEGNIFSSVCKNSVNRERGGSASVHAAIRPGPGTPPNQPHIPDKSRHPPQTRHPCWEIRSTSGRYGSYWNAIQYC